MFDVTLLNSTVRMITPILLAAMGGLLCERVLVFNIALEGTMLLGAFVAVAASFYSGSALVGVLTAALVGVAFSLLLALFVVTFRSDAIVCGIALNLLASGLSTYLLRRLFGARGQFTDPRVVGLGQVELPFVGQVPFLGDILSGHSWVVYFSWAVIAAVYVLLFKQVLGLRMRGVGQNDTAAETLGVNVGQVRYVTLAICGLLTGIAGAQLSLGQVTLYVENMSAGRGWIAVVAVMLGKAHPIGVTLASLLFGFAEAMSYRLQGLVLPFQLADIIPYVVTLTVLFMAQASRIRRARALAA